MSADTVFSRDWFSDVGDTLSGAFSSAWDTVANKETWNTVADTLKGAGVDAVDAGAATVGLRNLVQLSLTSFTMFKCEVNQDLKISRRFSTFF